MRRRRTTYGVSDFIADKLLELLILAPALALIVFDRWIPKHISESRWVENAIIIGVAAAWFLFAIGPGKRIIRRWLRI